MDIEIIGKWTFENGEMIPDDNCRRIEKMLQNELIVLESSKEGWTKLCEDKNGTLWELTYPESHLHGGGPPKLRRLNSR
ncbi:MAG: hypothetical protein HWE24_07400 [Oceanospirillaceae bacterium]|nr:hypothetical protein [Oceanospirillaceae bacterium]